jgi:hypothetical protein
MLDFEEHEEEKSRVKDDDDVVVEKPEVRVTDLFNYIIN